MRVVLDANVIVSAVIGSGAPAEIPRRWKQGSFELIVSEHLLTELAATLARPKLSRRLRAGEASALVELLRDGGTPTPDPSEPPRRSRDSADDYLIALAESAEAMLVSGDRDLLELGHEFPIVSPREFLALLD